MKIRHLLLGLMICVAGTGAIDLSGGFLDDQNTTQLTPFLIFGHVLYEGGAPCNNPNVSITNMDTGAAWYADVSADDVLRWSATDGAVVNTTNRTVDQGDLEGSGIFDFDVILQSIAPIIRGYAPESPVYDIEDATRRFNITINQVVDVTWLINSSPAQTDESVTDASYTHTNVAIGVWNISARASNENGTAMQEWIWNVASATAPPPAAPFVVCGRVNYEGGGICEEHAVNITNLNTGTRWQAETRSGYSYYELIPDSADVGTGDVLEFNVTDGVGYNETTRTVTQDDLDRGGLFDLNLTLPVLAPSVGVELTPDDDPVMPGVQVINPDYLTANRTVTITADVTDPDCYENITGVIANITGTGTIGDSPVSLTFVSNSSATTARYIGKFNMSSHPVGDYEVVVNATNTGGFTGTAIRSFTYQYEATAHLPLSPFIIYGSVSYDNGTSCNSPFVAITNLNTSEELIADNRTGEGFYQLVTSSTFANAGDVMRINASKDGSPVGNATYTVNQTEIEHGAIEVDINKRYLPDFTVTNLTFDLSEPLLIGDLVTINAMITNSGESEGNTSVEFYDNKSITIERTRNNYLESPINDTITLPDILRIRVHFESFDASGGNITIYNETQPVEMLGEWTEWCDGDTVRIESWNAMFTVDRYEAVLATNKSITLGEGDSINLSAKWDLSLQEMGWATNGTHNITVRVDPCDQVIESNETNNEETRAIDVHPSLDFAVTEVSLDPSVPVLGDVAEVSANITNYGVRTGTAVVGVYYDNKSMDIGGAVGGVGSNSTDIISLPPGVLGARLHFKQVKIHDGEVAIYDGDGRMVERITHGRWTDWIYGENITIRIELLPQQRRIDSLFDTTNLTWEDDLNNGTVPEELKDLLDEGYDDDYSLSDNATVEKKGEAEEGEAEEGKDEWIIIDGGKERYWIIKESDKLKVYHYYYYGTYKGEFTINRYEALIAEEPVTLNATESKVINASWRTGAAYGGVGYHDLTVVVDPRDTSVETNETNNTLTEQVLVNGTDLTVTAIEMPCGLSLDNLCYVGQDVPVNVTIANIGAIDATNFTVVFLDGNCSDYGKKSINSTPFTEVHIDRLNIGESRNILVVWNPAETGWHMITASIPYDNIDNNGTNNELSGFSRVEPRYDFLVGSVNVEPQKNVRRGESVNITATIGNIGQGGGNVSIGFFVNSTDFAGSCGERFIRIGTIDDVYAEVNETETVSITWDVDVGGGSHLIAAVVNPDNDDDEINGTVYDWSLIRFRGNNTGNNVKTCTLQVLPNNLTITDLTLDPAEPNICDIVDISANITNNGNTTANSTVWFYMEQNSSQRLIHQPEDVMMRVHIAWVEWYNGYLPWSMYAYVNDSHDQRKPVCFYYKDTEGGMVKVPYIMSGPYNGSPPIPCSMIIDNSDDGSRHTYVWKDIWTDWGYGDTFEIKGAPGNCSIDRYQVRLGNETVTLYPDESMTYHGAWNAIPPIKAGEYYRLMANVENRTIYTNETYLGGTDLAITNLSVRSVVYDGDRVWVNATIGNLGRMDATDFIVNFTEVYDPEEVYVGNHADGFEHLELINTTHIEGLDIGNSINISVSWNASIRDIECEGKCYEGVDRIPCNWTETADDYNIRVEINTLENGDKEEDDTNHIREPHVDVDESRDFNVTDLSFYANNKSRDPSKLVIYDDVTLNTTLNITNLANQGGIVDVSFYIDDASAEHKIGNTTVAFPVGGGTGYAEIKWKVENFGDVDVTGEHNMTVVVDPENRIYEIDGDQNTTYIQPIYVMASDLLVESLEFHPESPVRGETASINVTLANHGDANASNLILTIYDWAERHIEDEDEQSGLGRDQIEITRDDATAMRLYLDLEIDGGMVCLNDRSGRGIIHYDKNFHGWTPWVLDNSTTIVVTTNKTHSAYAKVSRVYYLTFSGIIDTSTHDLDVNETKNVTVDWNPSSVGERFVAAIVDPEDCIIESDEFNNRLVEFMSVQAADILVSNLSLAWHNGTEIGEDEIIKDGDDVRISANLSNIGVEDAGSFNVRFLVDDLLIKNEVIGGLVPDELICVSADWSAAVGDRLIKVEVDYVDEIDETNETNNIVAMERYVCGAELSGNTSWKTLGLHGRILFEPTQPYDEDEVVITAIVNNSGYAPAENFSAALFFGYEPDTYYKRMRSYGSTWKLWGELESMRYDDAVCIYLNVSINNGYPILAMYDGNDTEVKRIDKSCWVRVPGDAVRVDCYLPNNYMSSYTIDFYPVYPDNLSQIMKLDVNSSIKLPPIKQNVSVDDYDVILFIDPENKAPEDEDYKEDNVIYKTMHVKPTRDFTVTNVTTLQTNFSDLDTPTIIANVSNIGLRNGTAEVDFVDYEVENRTYKYHFDINRSPSYLPIPPDGNVTLLERCYDNLTIIHRPGVDAIDLHFNRITLPAWWAPAGVISIYDGNGSLRWFQAGGEEAWGCYGDCNIPLVPGETAYIYTNDQASFDLDRYTTETEFHREEVRLNASKAWNESKNVTPIRTAYTGDHTIVATLDGDDKITEINESNNELPSSLFHVNTSRDPAIVGINITPENPRDGDNVDITAVVANNGSKNASFTVDLWANLTRNKPDPDESMPDANLTTNMGGKRIRYITLLNHTTVTLAPGENTTVNATWCDISIDGDPTHHIIAIVDATDEIDEINESNNEIVKRIIPINPDLTIGTAHVHGGTGKVVVPIRNIGASGASNVTVRFESSETETRRKSIGSGWWGSITHLDARNMQVHFEHLRAPDDGCVEVRDSLDLTKPPIATYCGMEGHSWSEWVKGDTVYIVCQGGGTYAEIDEYRWGNVSDTTIDYLPAGGSKSVDMPWPYEYPRMTNVTVDPDNNITEINEGNNEKSMFPYADLNASGIAFVCPEEDKLSLDAEKFVIDGNITNRGSVDGIIVPVSDFDVTLEFRSPNGDDVVFNITEHIEEPLYANEERTITFEFDPSEKFEVGGNYTMRLIADSSNDVRESNELYYPDGEYNNTMSLDVYVHNTSGYTGGGELVNVAQGEVNGRVVYTIGDTVGDYEYGGMISQGGTVTVRYADAIPDDIDPDDIEFARLFLYWYTWTDRPDLAGADMKFNGYSLVKAGNYSDNPGAAEHDCGYGLYSYDVTDYVNSGENEATMTTTSVWRVGVQAIGLLVVYKDEDEPLTKYWINEGADVQLAKNRGNDGEFDTGLPYSECIAYARFKDVESDDIEGVNATLMTILGMNTEEPLYPDAGGEGDRLWFNDYQTGTPLAGTNRHYWEHLDDSSVSVTKNRWEDVTDHLEKGDNEAEMGSRGNFIMPNNAFLRLIFPPDLNVINLTAPKSTVVGAHHSINTTLRNDGRSDAHDFNVTFYIDRKQMIRIPHLDLPAGENMTIHLYNWTPMLLLHSYNLTVAADVLSGEGWTEVETDNNAMTKHVTIEEGGFGNQTGPRGTGGGSNPTGGECTEPITGRVMDWMTFHTGGGGGGAGMFSALEWVMKGAVWLVLMLFVCAGYRMEQRSYGRMRVGLRQPYL